MAVYGEGETGAIKRNVRLYKQFGIRGYNSKCGPYKYDVRRFYGNKKNKN